MKPKTKIKDLQHYQELLNKFKSTLEDKIPYAENCLVQFNRDPTVLMQYGPSAVVCTLETESSGRDNYIIYVDNNNEVNFIRSIGEGDKM